MWFIYKRIFRARLSIKSNIYENIMKSNIKDLRIFAMIWAVIFVVIGIYPLLNMDEIQVSYLVIAVTFIVIALTKPTILGWFYKIMLKFSEFIGGIVSKVILFILFFCMFTPVALFLKFMKKDLLKKNINKDIKSYWVCRDKQPESMRYQF